MRSQPHRFYDFLVFSASLAFGVGFLQAQPTNDLFANRIIVTGTNIFVTGSNSGATNEPGEPVHAGVGGGLSVWWSWTAPFNGPVTIKTHGSSYDTALGVYTGSSVSNLATIASNDDEVSGQIVASIVTFSAIAGQAYQVAVDGWDGDFGDIQLRIQLAPPAPAWLLLDPYGVPVNSTNFAGKVMILNFWATWCSPCLREMDDLIAVQEKYRADGLVVIGADTGESVSTVTNWLATNSEPFVINYQIVMGTSLEGPYGGVSFLPTTFFINRQNQIVTSEIGSQTQWGFEQKIIPLLYDNMRLSSQKNGNQLLLTWPTNAVTFLLDSSPTLKNPVWTQWPTNPIVSNGLNTVTVSSSGTNRYFRLRLSQ